MVNKEKISRRTAFRYSGYIGGITGILTSLFSDKSCATVNKENAAFALIGDRYHNSDYIRTALGKTLVKDAGLSIDFTDEVRMLSSEILKNYRMLIIFRDGMLHPDGYMGAYPGYIPGSGPEMVSVPPLPAIGGDPEMWMTGQQGLAVKEFVKKGGSALFFHNASHISLSNKDYRDVEGAIYTGHPPVRAFRLRITNHDHPITRGVNDFLVLDEQHYVKYDKDSKHVFMRSENAEGLAYGDQGTTCEAGWAYDYGKGKVCFLAPGHMISVLWNPEYVKLQKNAVTWLLEQ